MLLYDIYNEMNIVLRLCRAKKTSNCIFLVEQLFFGKIELN